MTEQNATFVCAHTCVCALLLLRMFANLLSTAFPTQPRKASRQLIVVLRRYEFGNLPLFVSASHQRHGLELK